MSFDEAAAQRFFAEPHVGVFAVEVRSGPPAAVPIWYSYTPGGEVWINTPESSRKARALRRTGQATMVVDTVSPVLRYVSVDLELVSSRPTTFDDQAEMAARYLSGDALAQFLEFSRAHLHGEVRYTLRPTRWRYADMTM